MPQTFTTPIIVLPEDIDQMGHVNNVVYVRWAQDVAYQHWVTKAPAELQVKYSWVVMRHEIDYKAPAFLKDDIQGSTWVAEFSGVRSIRLVQITRADKLLCEIKTTWCLLDAASLRPARIPAELASFF
jgi:acyl-CoA thioester hydrolase